MVSEKYSVPLSTTLWIICGWESSRAAHGARTSSSVCFFSARLDPNDFGVFFGLRDGPQIFIRMMNNHFRPVAN